MLRDTSRHLVVGSALAFVGSVLAGTVIGLPAALAQSGLGVPAQPQTRLAGTLSHEDIVLAGRSVVAADLPVTLAGLTEGAPVKVVPLPVLPAYPAVGSTVPVSGTNGADGTPDPAAAGALGIPAPVLDAYKRAAELKNRQMPSCRIDWSLLAAVGKVESDHAAGGKVDATGRTRGVIEGPMTAHGTAKGPMQFIDSSWTRFGADGNGDGIKDVHNIYDASLAAANHLCASGGGNLQNPDNLQKGIFGYNRAGWYVTKVITWMNQYGGRAVPVPPAAGDIPARPVTPVAPVTPIPTPEPAVPPTADPSTPTPTPDPEPTSTPTQPTESGTLEPPAPATGGLKGSAAVETPEPTP